VSGKNGRAYPTENAKDSLLVTTVLRFWQNGSTVLPVKTLTIKVPDALFAEIASAAETRKVSKSEIVRERLTAKPGAPRTKKASLWSRMEDLVIPTDSLPTDLSSNKAHLKGYGKKRSH
jgi:Ribbon-helix-helix protein, copG family